MPKESKGVRLDHISKIYTDPKTGKDFYAVHDVSLDAPGPLRLRKNHDASHGGRL